MPIIDAATLGDDYEDKIAPEGEYELRIQKADYGKTAAKDGKVQRDMITVMLKVDGADGDGVAPFNEYLVLPNSDEQPKTRRLFMQRLTRFLTIFRVPTKDGFDPEEAPSILPGLTAKAPLVQEEGNDGVLRNRLKLPRVGR